MNPDYNAGEIILIDKPLDWTSFAVVKKVKWLTKAKKVGHAGTLDPRATGLLILCTGKFTKRISEFQDQEKEYTGSIVLGATTPTYDTESEVDQTYEYLHLSEAMIKAGAEKLSGVLEQIPPIFSAKKVDGKRAYDLARKGKEVELKASTITVYAFEITKIELPEIEFRIRCSKGTYIRSLAHDLGKVLNSGAYLKTLRRTKIGDFSVEDAHSMDKFISLHTLQSPDLKS